MASSSPSLLSIFTLLLLNSIPPSTPTSTITKNQSLADGQTLISSGGAFELGFFSPGSSRNRYVGIWYKNIPVQQVIWVANRESPISSSTGVLYLTSSGSLAIGSTNSSNNPLWSTNSSISSNSVLQILDSGNLVLTDGDSKSLLWQSFDYPSHALLPGMKIGKDFTSNLDRRITSWKSESDPSPGAYAYKMDTRGVPELYLVNGLNPLWRSGPWRGSGWSGLPDMAKNEYLRFHFISRQDEVYYSYELTKSIVSPMVLNPNGSLERLIWVGDHWFHYWNFPMDQCDEYTKCGSYGVCESSSVTTCNCIRGFEPKSSNAWGMRDWSGGCVRRVALNCTKGDGFVKAEGLKLPDTSRASTEHDPDECRSWCLSNCSCNAFAVINGGKGCITWVGDLKDMRVFEQGGDELYLRLAASELDEDESSDSAKKKLKVVIAATVFVVMVLICVCIYLWKKHIRDDGMKDYEQPLFSFTTLAASTNNFSEENKIGEGGFGPVYKGKLSNGQEIAVKRLSRGSGQGNEEFKNEIRLIANVQHKNLVRLLGCCIKGEERILVYEYMPNKSLDSFIFDPIKAQKFDWQRRTRVIEGVAQGLLYLHKYSRLKIIHRDLKCSNILLDAEMNPKISDFGIARIFGGNQDQASTKRVVGTYGYMSPEYAIRGFFSEKSDVFSFGVLLLELVSGKRNGSSNPVSNSWFLLQHAWESWVNNRVSDIMDPVLCGSCPSKEMTRCVHVGLLCVQEDAESRPSMSSVVSFLGSDTADLPSPKRVSFSALRVRMNDESHPSRELYSSNDLTVTTIVPR